MSLTHLPPAHLDRATLHAYRKEVERLPVTMRPELNQQLSGWSALFPFEQSRLLKFIDGIRSFSPAQLAELTGPLGRVEAQMDVARWNFSTDADTMENASLLARSPYYAEWRKEMERVFAAIDTAAPVSSGMAKTNRAIVIVFPETLPVGEGWAGKRFDARSIPFRLQGDAGPVLQAAMRAAVSRQGQSVGAHRAQLAADSWMIDADAMLGGAVPAGSPVSLLQYELLHAFRDEFLREVNTVPKDIEGTDKILAGIRRKSWEDLWPRSLAGEDRLRRFVMEVFLSGNGALIFSNAFVQWSASEALRRARPRVMVARFGLRSKPKPFTSIAIFENQQTVSAMRDEPDPQGSAIDALILARYIWLSMLRYPEAEQTCCLCVSERDGEGCVVAPEGRQPDWKPGANLDPAQVSSWLERFLA